MRSFEIICMEDEKKDALDLKEQLEVLGGLQNRIKIVADAAKLQELLRAEGTPPRVVILDWLIGHTQEGQLGLKLVREFAPFATPIVFTNFGENKTKREIALREGADYFLGKGAAASGVWTQLYKLVSEGRTLSILRELAEETEWNEEGFSLGLPLELSPSVLAKVVVKHWDLPKDKPRNLAWELVQALEDLSNWNRLNTEGFGELPFTSQLKELVIGSGKTVDQFARWLRIPGFDLVLDAGLDVDELTTATHQLRMLLDVLWWTMRRARYSPFIYRELLHQTRNYSDCARRPPWDDVGIYPFMSRGLVELQASAEWIREKV